MNRNELYFSAILAVAGLIVAPAVAPVNSSPTDYLSEGSPLPAPVPQPPLAPDVIVAEGSPLPAPVPQPPAFLA